MHPDTSPPTPPVESQAGVLGPVVGGLVVLAIVGGVIGGAVATRSAGLASPAPSVVEASPGPPAQPTMLSPAPTPSLRRTSAFTGSSQLSRALSGKSEVSQITLPDCARTRTERQPRFGSRKACSPTALDGSGGRVTKNQRAGA